MRSTDKARDASKQFQAENIGMRIVVEHGELPPVSCERCKIARHTICRPTIEEAPKSVCALRQDIRTMAAGRIFLHAGEVPESTGVLYSGWTISYKQLSDGRRQIISFQLPGDTLVLDALCFPGFPLPYSVKALTAISICAFNADDMMALMQRTAAQKREVSTAHHRYTTYLHDRVFDLGRRSASGRLAQLLLDIYDRLDGRGLVAADDSFDLPATQEHLADALGLTTAYVNRTLGHLRQHGIVSVARERATIHDEAELRRIAEEE